MKRTLKLERVNADPQYFREQICSAFPELSAGDVDSGVLKLWQVRENRTQLSPLPVDVNNARALFSCDQLKRSCVYITADVSTNFYQSFLSFPLLRGDCECRVMYDSPQSVLRPHMVWPNARFTPDVCKLVNGWHVTLPEADVCCVSGMLLPYVSSARLKLFRFTRCMPCLQLLSGPGACRPSQQSLVHAVPGVVHVA